MVVVVADGIRRTPAGPMHYKGGVMPFAGHYDDNRGYYFPATPKGIKEAQQCAKELQEYTESHAKKKTLKAKR